MFDEMVESKTEGRSRSRWAFPISALTHVVIVAVVVGASYLVVEAVKETGTPIIVVAVPSPPPPPPPPPPPAGSSATPETARVPQIEPEPFVQPKDVPAEPPVIEEEKGQADGDVGGEIGGEVGGKPGGKIGGTLGGEIGGVLNGVLDGAGDRPILPTPDMVQPVLIHKVTPEYPETMRVTRRHGKVILQAVIDVNGNVGEVTVLRTSNAMFNENAIAAVQKWKYSPALRDGKPVAVYFTVVVEFELN